MISVADAMLRAKVKLPNGRVGTLVYVSRDKCTVIVGGDKGIHVRLPVTQVEVVG